MAFDSNPSDIVKVSREQLYEAVWAESMVKVAARYKVSSNFLARVCERLNVPHPTRGYWAKLSFGQATKVPALPPAQPGDPTEWVRGRSLERDPDALPDPSGPKYERPSPKRPQVHPLVTESTGHFETAQVLEGGYLRPTKRLVVDLFVSKEILPRALKVASELYLALEDRGLRVVIAPHGEHFRSPHVDPREDGMHGYYHGGSWSPARPTVAFLGNMAFGLTLYELSENADARLDDHAKWVRATKAEVRLAPHVRETIYKHEFPSGRLCLRVFSPYAGCEWQREWREEKPGDLLKQFGNVAETIEREAPGIVNGLKEAEEKAAVERKEIERQIREYEAAEAQRKQDEARDASREQLLEIIEKWALARRIEAFLEEARKSSAKLNRNERLIISKRLEKARELLQEGNALELLVDWKAPSEREES